MEISPERRQKFWEECGFHRLDQSTVGMFAGHWWYTDPGANRILDIDLPKLDLNSLFKYAVPKTLKVIAEKGFNPPIMKLFQLWYDELVTIAGNSSDTQYAAQALFLVIEKLI